MDTISLATSAVAASAQQTRDGFAVAALRIANQQQQAIAGLVAQTADRAQTAPGVGGIVDRVA